VHFIRKRKQPPADQSDSAKDGKVLSPSKHLKREDIIKENKRVMYQVASEVMKDVKVSNDCPPLYQMISHCQTPISMLWLSPGK